MAGRAGRPGAGAAFAAVRRACGPGAVVLPPTAVRVLLAVAAEQRAGRVATLRAVARRLGWASHHAPVGPARRLAWLGLLASPGHRRGGLAVAPGWAWVPAEDLT